MAAPSMSLTRRPVHIVYRHLQKQSAIVSLNHFGGYAVLTTRNPGNALCCRRGKCRSSLAQRCLEQSTQWRGCTNLFLAGSVTVDTIVMQRTDRS